MNPLPKVIFFDCWYTLFTSDFGRDVAAIAHLVGAEPNHSFVKELERALMLRPYSDLKAPVARLLEQNGKEPDTHLIGTIEKLLISSLERQHPFPETLETLARLGRTHTLGLITNSFSLGFEHLRAEYHLDNYFAHIVTSYEAGHIKPDPAIFQTALQTAGAKPHEAAMVGDSLADDIEPAKALGLQAILVDRRGRHSDYPDRITGLRDLL